MALALMGFWTMLPPGNGADSVCDVFPRFPDEERSHSSNPGNIHCARWFRYGDYPGIDSTVSLYTVVRVPQEDTPFSEVSGVAGEAAVALWLERRALPFLGLDTETAQAMNGK